MTVNHVFSAFSFISLVLVSIPFPWHFQARNTGTCMYILWTFLSTLGYFVNSILWDGNFVNWSPGWCDISVRLVLGINIAIPAAALCIQRQLYYIISDPVVHATRADRRRSMIVDLLIGLGLPIINIILAYLVQNRRYDIFEDFGCFPVILNTALSLVLINSWPIIIGIVTGIYCSMNIYHFWIKRRSIRSVLASSTGTIGVSLYLRLMILSGINILCTIPLAVWNLYTSVAFAPLVPYPGLAAIHADYSQVDQIPTVLWQSTFSSRSGLEISRWSCVMCALIFFIFFGFADEARKNYTHVWQTMAKMVGYSHVTGSSNTYGSATNRPFGSDKLSATPSDSFVLPIFSRDRPSNPDKLSPFGLPYSQNRSTLTVSNNSDAESKCGTEASTSQDSETSLQAPPIAITHPC